MNKIPMLLKAAEYIKYLETVNPLVIESEHDYASTTRSITSNNGSHHYGVSSSKIPRESRFVRGEPTSRRGDEDRVRLRPRPTVEAPSSTRSKVQTRSAKRKRRHESPVSDGSSQHEDSTIRSIHNQAEKIRRDQMRTEIDRLKVTLLTLLPGSSSDYSSAPPPRTSHHAATPNISTQQTLNLALDVIKRLQASERSKEQEMRKLMEEQQSLERMCKKLGHHYSNINNNIVISHFSNILDDDDDTSFLSAGSHDGSSGCYSNRSSPDFIDVTSVASDSASLASEDSGLAMLID